MPEGARTLEEPHKSPIAERVEATYCVTKDLTVTGDDLKARLSTAGWQGVSTRPHPSIKERLGVVGKKAPYMLTGSLQHSQDPRCSGAKGEVLVSMGVHKLEEKRSEAALPPLRPTESDWKARPDGTIYIPGRTAAPTRVSPGLQGAKPSMPSAPTKTQ